MSGWRRLRLIAPALLLAHLAGCGADAERGSTLPSGDEEANPAKAARGAAVGSHVAPADLPTVAASTLADDVLARARALAAAPYRPPVSDLPEALTDLDYDAYRSIRFRPESALWRGESAFEVQLMHPGSVYGTRVGIHLVEGDTIVELPFDGGSFSYDGPAAPLDGSVPADVGYSGFRVHYPLNDAEVRDEVVVFQGASYFRLLGPGHVHGLSARGLGIDIGHEEVFPDFTDFWLVRPGPDASTLVFHALLDSPAVTGAYRFELAPGAPGGAPTRLRVDARLVARADAPRIGVAPFSSMFLHGAEGAAAFDDYRPEVHDSDGLLMRTHRDEWIWRPLRNRDRTSLTALLDQDPRGFGLVQRGRDFDRYLDLEARYHERPSVWVRVDGDWGAGSVQLLEMPSGTEFSDNVAASWVPDGVFGAGEERRYRYELETFDGRLPAQTLGQVERTRSGAAGLPGEDRPTAARRFVVDFAGGALDGVAPDAAVEPVLETTAGRISELRAVPLPDGQGWRASFRLDPEGARPADMRLRLDLDGEPVTETWSHLWDPEGVG